MTTPLVIFTADDLGAHPAINAAIGRLVELRVLDRVSALVNYPNVKPWNPPYQATCAIGLHLNITSGRPISLPTSVPSLVCGTGTFHCPTPALATKIDAALNTFKQVMGKVWLPEDLVREFSAQLETFRRLFQSEPAFVNVHHDMDQVSCVLQACEAVFGDGGRVSAISRKSLAAVTYTFVSEDSTLEAAQDIVLSHIYKAIELSVREGLPVEVCCHPSDNGDLSSFTAYRRGRILEAQAWASPAVRDVLRLMLGRQTEPRSPV